MKPEVPAGRPYAVNRSPVCARARDTAWTMTIGVVFRVENAADVPRFNWSTSADAETAPVTVPLWKRSKLWAGMLAVPGPSTSAFSGPKPHCASAQVSAKAGDATPRGTVRTHARMARAGNLRAREAA